MVLRLHRDFGVFDLPETAREVWTRFWRTHTRVVASPPGALLVEVTDDARAPGRDTAPEPALQIATAVARALQGG